MHEGKLCKREIVGKLSIEIVLREKLMYDDWLLIVIEQNENKIKTKPKQIRFYCLLSESALDKVVNLTSPVPGYSTLEPRSTGDNLFP